MKKSGIALSFHLKQRIGYRDMSTFRFLFLFACLSIALPSFVNAEDGSKKKSLLSQQAQKKEILRYALKHNPSLKSFEAQVQKAFAKYKGSKVFPNNPILSSGGGVQIPSQSGGSILPRIEAELSIEIPIGGRWSQKQKLAHSQLQKWRIHLLLKRFTLLLEIHRSFIRVAAHQQIWQGYRSIHTSFKQIEQLTKQRIKHGSATKLDLQFIQISQIQAEQDILNAQSRYQLALQRLMALIGWETANQNIPWKIRQLPTLPTLSKSYVMTFKKISKHPQIQMAKAKIKQARSSIAFAKSLSIPDLSFSLQYSFEDSNHVMMGAISIPLPLFWRNQGQIGQSKAQLRHTKQNLARERFRLQRKAHRTLQRYRIQERSVRLVQKHLQVVEARSKLLEKGFKEGSFSLFQVLTTKKNILKVRLSLLKSILAAHKTYIDLCQAVGKQPSPSISFASIKKENK